MGAWGITTTDCDVQTMSSSGYGKREADSRLLRGLDRLTVWKVLVSGGLAIAWLTFLVIVMKESQ